MPEVPVYVREARVAPLPPLVRVTGDVPGDAGTPSKAPVVVYVTMRSARADELPSATMDTKAKAATVLPNRFISYSS